MIFDCFLYAGEQACLDIRVAELSELDVMHIAVQANKTFTNKPKEFHEICSLRVADMRIMDMPDGNDPWERERHQRNSIMRGLQKFYIKDDDLIIISDADEVPSAAAIMKYNKSMEVAALTQNKYGYWLNCMEGYQDWNIAKILTYELLKKSTPDQIRNSGQQSWIEHAGWHWSYLGNKETILKKLDSFSHTECNTEDLRSKIGHKINTGQSLWGDDYWPIVPIDNAFPKYVVEHQYDILSHLIKKV